MDIRVGDFVRWTGEKLDKVCEVYGITINKKMLPFTDGKPRKALFVRCSGAFLILELEGIEGIWTYPISLLEVIPQEPELPEYGEKILVWDMYENHAEERIYINYAKGALHPVIVVADYAKKEFEKGEKFALALYKHFKRIEKDDKLEELRKILKDAQETLDNYIEEHK